MRRAGRIDGNQKQIVKSLRQLPSCSVQVLSAVGHGCPDLLVGFRGRNYLLEVKLPNLPPSQHLTPDERDWLTFWCGQATVVHSIDEALNAIGAA